MRCPRCGSSAQPKVIQTEYKEDGWDIEVVRTYKCGCGCAFTGTSCFYCSDGYEIIGTSKKVLDKLNNLCYN